MFKSQLPKKELERRFELSLKLIETLLAEIEDEQLVNWASVQLFFGSVNRNQDLKPFKRKG